MAHQDWKGQNIPHVIKEFDGSSFSILPVLECFLKYKKDKIDSLLPSADSYGWGDDFANSFAWAKNAYRVVDFIPDFSRYGCLPSWFPTIDRLNRKLTGQGQVDRFLFMVDLAYGGLLDDHHDVDPRLLAQAIMDLKDDLFWEYVSIEEGENIEWEIEA